MNSAVLRRRARDKILKMYRDREEDEKARSTEPAISVLVADDDSRYRSALKRLLAARAWAGQVWEAEDGEQAILGARVLHPRVVLMDLAMPRINGLEATRLIKAAHPDIFVVVCSIHNDPIFRRYATLNGADAFLPKSSLPPDVDLVQRMVLREAS
jgi:DNA-binding NarL/FixJ family response regulator